MEPGLNNISARLKESLQMHQRGNTVGAERGYRNILELDPDNVDANHLLGMLFHERGESAEAISHVERAVHLHPGSAALLNSLCVVLMGEKRFRSAEEAALLAIRIAPDHPEARRNLSKCRALLTELSGSFSSHDQSAGCISQMQAQLAEIQRYPTRTHLLRTLFSLGEQTGRLDIVVEACVFVLKKNPSSVPGHLILGMLFSSRIPPEQMHQTGLDQRTALRRLAYHHLKQAFTLRPSPETLDAWGVALLNANRQRDAIAKFDSAIAIDKRFAKSFENRGRAHLELGQIADAVADYKKAIAIDASLGLAQYDLAKIGQDRVGTLTDTASLLNILESQTLSTRKRSLLNYALGFRHEQDGESTKAFERFRIANQSKIRSSSDRSKTWRSEVEASKRVFSADRLGNMPAGYDHESPIFIVSMPRSGTTLIETVLSRHPSVAAGGEMFAISDLAHTLHRRLKTELVYPDCMSLLQPEFAEALGREYCEHAFHETKGFINIADRQGQLRITDKMPTNFWYVGLIASILPKAQFIHVDRNPMDVCLSCFKQNLTWPFCDLEAIVTYLEAYRSLMTHWKTHLPNMIWTVRYEEFVASPEKETKQMLRFCDLPWDESCLNSSLKKTSVQTPSKWQVRQPIYQSSVGGWKRYENQLKELQTLLVDKGFRVE
ncbi:MULTISPECIES: tetratricopeptide repeat-containing sulfotransferase family protein [Rhodopirellula]|uniref:tetratricopeptide repeat-containing sulfotransferase family protein n=1 Tax=Rhodopirellula TaxID=265488 RepID=UPI00257AC8A9|nr:tetratricopeptide repeat-containing sulfotransferase family protein [Rhodopirellula sp. UBA1907]